MWAELPRPWRRAHEIAWEAYALGTVPAGAVLVDGNGRVVAEGHNGVYASVPSGIHHSPLAHAEINALVALDPARRYEDYVLYASLEPCLLCLGAAVMAAIGEVRFAGRDPYGGASKGLGEANLHQRRLPLAIVGPSNTLLGVFASALLCADFLERKPAGHVVQSFQARHPTAYRLASRLLVIGARARAARGEDLLDTLVRATAGGCSDRLDVVNS